MSYRVIKSTCRGCHGVRGVRLHMKDDKLVKVTGDPESPTSQGYLCVKGKSAPELLYHPDRLQYPLKRAGSRGENKWQRITWVPADVIKAAARLYATTKPACLQWGVGIDQGVNNFQTIRVLLILSGITGNIDVPGGDVFWVPPANVVNQVPRLNPDIELPAKLPLASKQKMIGASKYKLSTTIQPREFINTVLTEKPYPIKALFIMGSNLLVGHSDCLRMVQALRKIDFIAATDLFMTPTTQLADIILPAASWPETDDVTDFHMVWCVTARSKVATIGECRDDKQIIFDLAHRMGMEDCFPWHNTTEYCDWLLQDTGMTFKEFKEIAVLKGNMQYKKHERVGFKTPSGKFEIYCSAMKDMGYDPLPYYVEPPESPYSTPDIFKEYPLIITTGARVQAFFHTEGRQIKSLRRLNPDPKVEIHPDTAKKLAVKNGDWVWIESPSGGRIKQRASLTESIHPGVVSAQHGWWFPEKEPWEYGFTESNVNILTHGMPCDPQTGSEPWRSFLCKISKV